MLPGDVVQFNVATDRRNGDRRAANVLLHRLIEGQRNKSGREQVGGAMTEESGHDKMADLAVNF